MQVATLKKPKKKAKAWPFVLLTILFLLFVLPIALVYGIFYDAGTKKVHYDEEINLKEVGNRIIVDSLNNTVSTAKMGLSITEHDMDNMINMGMKKAGMTNPYVHKAYMYVRGNAYTFVVDVNAVVLKTRVRVMTTLSENEDKSAFVFTIKDASIGRITGLKGAAKPLIDRFLTDDTVNSFLKSTGLSLTFSRENLSITYVKEDMMKDLAKLTQDESIGLYFDILTSMLQENMVKFNLDTNKFAEAYLDLAELRTNELVTDDASHIKVLPETVTTQCRDNLVALIDHGDINPESVDLQTVYSFLFNGWERISDEERAVIEPINMNYIEIPDVHLYTGIIGSADTVDDLITEMEDTINVDDLISMDESRNHYICTLSESIINKYIAGQSIIGYTTLLHRADEHGYKVNYITVDNFYCNLYVNSDDEEIAEFVCKINMNGYHTSLTFSTVVTSGGLEGSSLVFHVRDIKYGQASAEELKKEFFGIICAAINGGDDTISANLENYTISFNFASVMQAAEDEAEQRIIELPHAPIELDTYFDASNIEFNIGGVDRNDEGSLSLYLINGIHY